ncbi:hypothetical protein BH11ACT8_BH11ACT8_07370 [soil metagenome]
MSGETDTSQTLGSDSELLSMLEVSAIVRTPVATLRYWRYLGTGPHSFKVGRAVRYWRNEVEAWLKEQSNNDPGPHAA